MRILNKLMLLLLKRKNAIVPALRIELLLENSFKVILTRKLQANDVKINKSNWELEVLAKKTASNVSSSTNQKQDDSGFKGNYPLLVELPTDMRPKLASLKYNSHFHSAGTTLLLDRALS